LVPQSMRVAYLQWNMSVIGYRLGAFGNRGRRKAFGWNTPLVTDSETWRADVLTDHPRVGRALVKAADNRALAARRLQTDGPRRQGINELLLHLDEVVAALDAGPIDKALVRLMGRLSRDFEVALEAAIAGYLSVVMDAMRDVMEATDLILMFSTDLDLVRAWSEAPDEDRWKKFGPTVVRQHLKQAKYRTDAKASDDYRGHSCEVAHKSAFLFYGRDRFCSHQYCTRQRCSISWISSTVIVIEPLPGNCHCLTRFGRNRFRIFAPARISLLSD
jgi:hypothetical protein